MSDPTLRQLQVLVAIADGWDAMKPSTIRELCVRFGIKSTNGMNDHLKALEKKGLLDRSNTKARLIHITPEGWRWVRALRRHREEVAA